jgi:hypothetical protein
MLRASSFSTTGAQRASVADEDDDEVSYVGGTLPSDGDHIMLEVSDDKDNIPELEEVDNDEDEDEEEEEEELCM